MTALDDRPVTVTAPGSTAPAAGTAIPARAAHDLTEVADGARITLDTLPGRDLDPTELAELAAGLAADPARWQDHVAFDPEHRHYVSVHRDLHVDVWVICWLPQNDTGWHDHDISSGAVAVAQGALTEHNLALGSDGVRTAVPAGKVFAFGPDHIHRLTGRDAGSVSVHAYSPPLWRMGQYSVGPGGTLHRRSMSYADELRPVPGSELPAGS